MDLLLLDWECRDLREGEFGGERVDVGEEVYVEGALMVTGVLFVELVRDFYGEVGRQILLYW